MQDRFKFRIFCKSENKMMLFNNPTLIDGDILKGGLLFKNYDHKIKNVHEVKSEDLILMQSTGLKDKNGTLIYEGDIVKIEYYDFEIKHRIGIVEWEDDGFCITYHNPKDTKVSGCSLVDIVNGDKQEVIGNIYETPELIGGAE